MVHFIFGPITPSPSFFIKKIFHSHYLNKAQVSYIFWTYNPVPRDHFYSCRNTIKRKELDMRNKKIFISLLMATSLLAENINAYADESEPDYAIEDLTEPTDSDEESNDVVVEEDEDYTSNTDEEKEDEEKEDEEKEDEEKEDEDEEDNEEDDEEKEDEEKVQIEEIADNCSIVK
ncbi:hypothetical protein [Pseudobutyrivibrio ruminis]|uniref:hypothetical protein n=1 Tax=Pseudobutyrivibrio ruminis TaxID=46206 RepID=UPI00167099EE|nr:hypothetical protein [Pseudobutyrivibrio ruminis]